MRIFGLILTAILTLGCAGPSAAAVRIKDLGRFLGWRDNALVGYGLVIGLGGSGDSPRNQVTRQALANALGRLGANLTPDQLQSRNVAAVMVTATLPPSANVGDKIDVAVSSIGDARSLAGGALLMTPLVGADQKPYALAQGQLVVGGYRFDSSNNVEQKNYPTSGVLPGGATVETPERAELVKNGEGLTFILADPDFTTAESIADGINANLGDGMAEVHGADQVVIREVPAAPELFRLIARIEDIEVTPQSLARVVINERSGTVVAGGEVQVSSVVVSQGDIKVSISADNQLIEPSLQAQGRAGSRSAILTNSKLEVTDTKGDVVVRFPSTTVADVVEGLQKVHVDTRGVINVLQAMKAAGSLHAQILVQ